MATGAGIACFDETAEEFSRDWILLNTDELLVENPAGDAFFPEKTSPHQETQNSANKLADASITTANVLFIVIISGVVGNRKTHAGHLPQKTEMAARFARTELQ